VNKQSGKQVSKLERLLRELQEVESAASEMLQRPDCKHGVKIDKSRRRIRDSILYVQASIAESK
jgi:hypothetical protein